MITDANGKPIVSEGGDARSIKIVETNQGGKMVWALEYHPSIQVFEFEEVFQVLGNVVAGIAQNARARKHEAIMQQKLKTELQKGE